MRVCEEAVVHNASRPAGSAGRAVSQDKPASVDVPACGMQNCRVDGAVQSVLRSVGWLKLPAAVRDQARQVSGGWQAASMQHTKQQRFRSNVAAAVTYTSMLLLLACQS